MYGSKSSKSANYSTGKKNLKKNFIKKSDKMKKKDKISTYKKIPSENAERPSENAEKPSENALPKNSNGVEFQIDNSFSVISDTNFRLQSKRVFLTYKHHIPFDFLISFIDSLRHIEKYVICHELGDKSHNYEHTHVTVEFEKKIDTSNCRYFEIVFNNNTIHANIGSTRKWPASCSYCLKQFFKSGQKNKNWEANFDVINFLAKSRNKDTKGCGIKELCSRISKHKNAYEAIKNEASDLNEVIAINAIFNNAVKEVDPKQIKYLKSFEKTLRKWQQQLLDILSEEPDRRHVYWIVDKIGGQGKSDFCSYIDTLKFPDKCLTIASTGQLRDIADVIRNWMEQGNYPEIILIDLPRTFSDRESIYTIIESIKNGRLTCTKYKGATLKFYSLHVMIFSNWMPKLKNLSMDRWKIMELLSKKSNDNNAYLIPINNDSNSINRKGNSDHYSEEDSDMEFDDIEFFDD